MVGVFSVDNFRWENIQEFSIAQKKLPNCLISSVESLEVFALRNPSIHDNIHKMTDVCLEVKCLAVGLLTLQLGTPSNWPCSARLTGPSHMPGLSQVHVADTLQIAQLVLFCLFGV